MTPIEKLANQVGFHTSYVNSFGDQVFATDESRQALLAAMGFDVSSSDSIDPNPIWNRRNNQALNA